MEYRNIVSLGKIVALTALAIAIPICAMADDKAAMLSLDQAVSQALQSGPDARLSQADLDMAKATLDQAVARNGFGLGSSVSLGRTSNSAVADTRRQLQTLPYDSGKAAISITGPLGTSVGVAASHIITEDNPIDQTTQLSISASSTFWDGYAGGRALGAVRQADVALKTKQAAENANRKTVIYSVKQAYYNLLAQQRQISVLQETLDIRSEELRRNQGLFDARQTTRIDLRQAQVNRTQAELDLAKANGDLAIAREKLSALMGVPLERQYAVAEVPDLSGPDVDPETAIKTALDQRQDLVQLDLDRQSGLISLALSKAQASPTVSVNGSFAFSNDWTTGAQATDLSFGVQGSYQILDSGSVAAQVRQAATQLQVYQIQREQLVASISTDVKSALFGLKDSLSRVDLASASVDLAQDQYELAKGKYDQGMGTNLDLLTASVALTTAKANLAAANSTAQLAILAFQNAMGN